MAELNFTAPTPVQMDAFLKAFVKVNTEFTTTDFFNPARQAPIAEMKIVRTVQGKYDSDREFTFPDPLFFSYLNQAENQRDGVAKTVIMLYVVDEETPTEYNYCDLLVFKHRWGTVHHYGTNFFLPYKTKLAKWCDSVGYDYCEESSTGNDVYSVNRFARVPVIHGTSLFAAWVLHKLSDFQTLRDQFPTTRELYDFGREHFPQCMPVASPVLLATMLPSYVNRHRSPEMERFDVDIRIPGFYEGCRQVPDKDPTWDFSIDGRRHETWRRYKYRLQVWDINGARSYLVKAVRALNQDRIIVDNPRFSDVESSEYLPPPYKIRRTVYYPEYSKTEFLPNPDFNPDGHYEEPYHRHDMPGFDSGSELSNSDHDLNNHNELSESEHDNDNENISSSNEEAESVQFGPVEDDREDIFPDEDDDDYDLYGEGYGGGGDAGDADSIHSSNEAEGAVQFGPVEDDREDIFRDEDDDDYDLYGEGYGGGGDAGDVDSIHSSNEEVEGAVHFGPVEDDREDLFPDEDDEYEMYADEYEEEADEREEHLNEPEVLHDEEDRIMHREPNLDQMIRVLEEEARIEELNNKEELFTERLLEAHHRYHHDQLPVHGQNGAILVQEENEYSCDIPGDIPYLHPHIDNDEGFSV